MPVVAARLPELVQRLDEESAALTEAQRKMESLHALCEDASLERLEKEAPAFADAVREARTHLESRNAPYKHAEVSGRYQWIGSIVRDVTVETTAAGGPSRTDRLDQVLTHRLFGPVIFVVLLGLVFQAVFAWAVPAMDLIEAGVEGLSQSVRGGLPSGWATDLLVDGVITGVGNVVIFLPQILLLFFSWD